MSIVSHLHQLFKRRNLSILYPYGAVERSVTQCPGVKAATSVHGVRTTTSPDSNVTAVKRKIASAPSTTSRARYWMAASAR